MRRFGTILALLVIASSSAVAGGDWNDDDYADDYEHEYEGRGEYRTYYGVPAYRVPYYVPYGYHFDDDEPHVYGPDCKVERKWKRGRYREKIECDDDD